MMMTTSRRLTFRFLAIVVTVAVAATHITIVQAFDKETCKIEKKEYCKNELGFGNNKCNERIADWCKFRNYKLREYANKQQCKVGERDKCLNRHSDLNISECKKLAINYCVVEKNTNKPQEEDGDGDGDGDNENQGSDGNHDDEDHDDDDDDEDENNQKTGLKMTGIMGPPKFQAFAEETCKTEKKEYCKSELGLGNKKCNERIADWCKFRKFKLDKYADKQQCKLGERDKCLDRHSDLNVSECKKLAINYCAVEKNIIIPQEEDGDGGGDIEKTRLKMILG